MYLLQAESRAWSECLFVTKSLDKATHYEKIFNSAAHWARGVDIWLENLAIRWDALHKDKYIVQTVWKTKVLVHLREKDKNSYLKNMSEMRWNREQPQHEEAFNLLQQYNIGPHIVHSYNFCASKISLIELKVFE